MINKSSISYIFFCELSTYSDLKSTIQSKIINTVALDSRVEIRGFGSFSKKNIRPRRFINPKTKEESYLGETSIMHFKSSKKLLHHND